MKPIPPPPGIRLVQTDEFVDAFNALAYDNPTAYKRVRLALKFLQAKGRHLEGFVHARFGSLGRFGIMAMAGYKNHSGEVKAQIWAQTDDDVHECWRGIFGFSDHDRVAGLLILGDKCQLPEPSDFYSSNAQRCIDLWEGLRSDHGITGGAP